MFQLDQSFKIMCYLGSQKITAVGKYCKAYNVASNLKYIILLIKMYNVSLPVLGRHFGFKASQNILSTTYILSFYDL